MLNLGPFSGKDISGLRIQPTLIDRILEGAAVLLVVASWVSALWVYTHVEDKSAANYSLMAAGLCTFIVPLLGACAYLPIRWVRFPVHINERNAATQYFFAIRVARVVNVFFAFMFLVLVFDKVEVEMGLAQGLCNILVTATVSMILIAFLVYYFFAFKYK